MAGERQRGAVWVTRPAPGLRSTAAALTAAGHEVVAAPVLEVVTVPPSPCPSLPRPDWLVLVSRNALRGLMDAVSRQILAPISPETRVAVVGNATAAAARAAGLQVACVPAEESATGLLRALAAVPLAGARVWIPTGNRGGSAARELPEALAARGAQVEAIEVYQTLARSLSPEEVAALARTTPAAVLLHSPSAAEAVWAATQPPAVTAWRDRALAVAIGPTTAARLHALGARQIATAAAPSDEAVTAMLDVVLLRDS